MAQSRIYFNSCDKRVVVRFVVEKDGSVTMTKVVQSVDSSLDKEAVRVVKSIPNWIPGKHNGHLIMLIFRKVR